MDFRFAAGIARPCQYSDYLLRAALPSVVNIQLIFGFYLSRKCRRDLWAFEFVGHILRTNRFVFEIRK